MSAHAPPGWPAEVPPPPSPGWDHRAVAWLLDRCPPEYRGYPVLRRHPQVLARLTAHHVDAALDAGRRATATARADLTDAVGADAVEQTLAVLDAERVRLIGERRAVALVEDALRGRRYVPRL